MAEFVQEIRIVLGGLVLAAQLVERGHERFSDEDAAVGTEMPARVGQVMHVHF
jgi:hypothetical protein